MNYFEIEYITLLALAQQDHESVETLAHELSRNHYGYFPRAENLATILAALEAGGYISVMTENGILTPTSVVTLTERGAEAVHIGGLTRLFSGMKEKAIQKNTKAFCAHERPSVKSFALDSASFGEYHEKVNKSINDASLWRIKKLDDGLYTLTLQTIPTYETDDDKAEISDITLLGDIDCIRHALKDLLDTALYFCESHKVRKILIPTVDKAYIMTFCEVADETGYTMIRVSTAPILFNRQRFVGKRDSDLDYAQCGSNVQSFTMSNAYALCTAVFYSVIDEIDLYDEEIGLKVNELYRRIG